MMMNDESKCIFIGSDYLLTFTDVTHLTIEKSVGWRGGFDSENKTFWPVFWEPCKILIDKKIV